MKKNCLYCKQEFTANRKDTKYCSDNHKRLFLWKEKNDTLKDLKVKFPFLFDKNYEWSEKDTEYINWCALNRDKVEKLIGL